TLVAKAMMDETGSECRFDRAAVTWLESHIDEIRKEISGLPPERMQTEIDRLTSALFSFFGECIARSYSGSWVRVSDAWWGISLGEAEVPPGATLPIGGSSVRIEVSDEPAFVDVSQHEQFGDLVGTSVEMRRLYSMLERVAATDTTVLVQGETGTGKDVVAR